MNTMTLILSFLGTAMTSGTVSAWLTTRLKSKKLDASQFVSAWETLTREQQDWRKVLMDNQERLQANVEDLTRENFELRKKIVELEGHNKELVEDNLDLNQRITELKTKLEQYEAKVA